MSFNPFKEKAKKVESVLMSLKDLAPKSYDKNQTDAYTKTRCILMCGTEYEAVWCKHHFNRHVLDNDARREVSLLRKSEQQQQKLIASLKPIDETMLETTIAYEQLAVDLTAYLAQRAKNKEFKKALDFALLEDFDHLYRYADMLDNDFHIKAETLVGKYTEIMPARPTISHHRHPYDAVNFSIDDKKDDLMTRLDVSIITAAEQQTMNYYMNLGAFYKNQKGRELYTEIAMVEEQHVTEYGSLIDPTATYYESLLMHEYIECYLYYSMYKDETDERIRGIWERLLEQEIAHLHLAKELLFKYENKDYEQVVGNGEFPELIKFHDNIDYVRKVLKNTVTNTKDKEGYIDINDLPKTADFYKYQQKFIEKEQDVPSHLIIDDYIKTNGEDYRFTVKDHPVDALKDRSKDNYTLGRKPE